MIPNATLLPNQNSSRERGGIFALRTSKALYVVGFLLLHIPLALIMKRLPVVATLHAFGTVLVALWFVQSARRPERVAYAGAYIVGAEVLWRMCQAQVFWEFGKYAVALIFILALIRHGKFKGPILPLLYFGLLIPSIFIIAGSMPGERLQKAISFNLSGPFALMACCLYFSRQVFRKEQLRALFLTMLAPIVGVAFVTLTGTLEASTITFGSNSNEVTSGGFGPNQVSAALGLGALVAIFMALDSRVSNRGRALMLSLAVFLGIQSALTFSRNGLYGAVICGGLTAILMLRDKKARVKLIFAVGLIFVLASIFAPRLDSFTNGALSSRFQNTSSTGRDRIALADVEIWKENILFGVGPGGSTRLHAVTFRGIASHTEYSRLLSEHGMLGLLALIMLGVIAIKNLARAQSPSGRAVTTALVVWSLLYMLTNAIRLVAPAFIFGLGSLVLLSEERFTIEAVKTRIKLLRLKLARLQTYSALR